MHQHIENYNQQKCGDTTRKEGKDSCDEQQKTMRCARWSTSYNMQSENSGWYKYMARRNNFG